MTRQDYKLIIERMDGNPAVKEIRASGEAIERLLSLTNTLVLSATIFAALIAFAAFYFNYQHVKAYSLCKEKRNKNNVSKVNGTDFEIKDGDWHHRGFSSKGDPKYEIWTQRKQ